MSTTGKKSVVKLRLEKVKRHTPKTGIESEKPEKLSIVPAAFFVNLCGLIKLPEKTGSLIYNISFINSL